jgi:excisionase family DNA binding protein
MLADMADHAKAERHMAGRPIDVLTASEAAEYLRVSRKTLYRLVAAGKVPGQRVGRSWRFRREDLVAFLRARP